MRSKYAAGSFVHPNPNERPERFVDALSAHLDANDYFAVLPLTDRNHSLLSRNKERLERTDTLVGVEDWERFRRANDDGLLFETVGDADVPTPETRVPESLSEVDAVADDLPYPVVIKPRMTSAWDESGQYHNNRITSTNYADSPAELRAAYRDLLADSPVFERQPPVVQEVIPGESKATVALADDGEVKARFQHEFERTYPIDGGRGAVRHGIREPRMLAYAERVVDRLGWTGPLHVEFIERPDGEFYLIEVNGRYWGSLALTVNSGVDVPWLHYLQLKGLDVRPPDTYRTDLYQRRLFYNDLAWLQQKLGRGEYDAVPEFVRSFATTREEFVSLEDPLPFVGALSDARSVAAGYLSRQVRGRLSTDDSDEANPAVRSRESDGISTARSRDGVASAQSRK